MIVINTRKTQCIGKLKQNIVNCLNTTFTCGKVYLYPGVINHIKKNHFYCYQNYLKLLPDILQNPDYIGINQLHLNSIELVKVYADIVLVSIGKNVDGYLYVSSLYDISIKKVNKRLNSGRLVRVTWQNHCLVINLQCCLKNK